MQKQNKATTKRESVLGQMLRARQVAIEADVSTRMRTARVEAGQISDAIDYSDAVIEGDLNFSLIQLKAETLKKVRAALTRLEAGEYGLCIDCNANISEGRLKALPFAVRCTTCQQSREHDPQHTRVFAAGRISLDSEALGY